MYKHRNNAMSDMHVTHVHYPAIFKVQTQFNIKKLLLSYRCLVCVSFFTACLASNCHHDLFNFHMGGSWVVDLSNSQSRLKSLCIRGCDRYWIFELKTSRHWELKLLNISMRLWNFVAFKLLIIRMLLWRFVALVTGMFTVSYVSETGTAQKRELNTLWETKGGDKKTKRSEMVIRLHGLGPGRPTRWYYQQHPWH
jgi:hypothetical protein